MSVDLLQVSAVVKHESYSPRTQDNDIAMMKLETEVPSGNSKIQQIVVAAGADKFEGAEVVVSGWGLLQEGK